MYLPEGDTEVDAVRARITERFWEYNDLCRHNLWPQYGAHQHWAKIEMPHDPADVEQVRRRLRARFPVDELNKARRELDPRDILSNTLLDGLLAELG